MSDELLTVDDLAKSFGGLAAVRGISFEVRAGEILGLLGPNGSGKTTVMNLISGEIAADRGRAILAGGDLIGLKPYQINRRRVARTFQLVRVLPNMTVRENIMTGVLFGADPAGRAAGRTAEDLMQRVGLGTLAGQPAGQLTYIEQKRVEMARALATQPKLLLLDEWLAGLNPTELREGMALIEQIRADGVTIVMVEHVMHAIRRLCDRVVVMNAGAKIAEGSPETALADPEVVRAYLGTDDA